MNAEVVNVKVDPLNAKQARGDLICRNTLYVTHICEFVTANNHSEGKILISIQ